MTPSFSARAFSFVLRKTGIIKHGFSGGERTRKSLAKSRAGPLPEPSIKLRKRLTVSRSDFQGRPVWHIAPKDRTPTAHILYWHGGGYVYPATSAHFDFLGHMAEKHGWSISAPLYPLAPEMQAIDIKSWVMDFYDDFLATCSDKPFFMGGDSAGGGMTTALSMAARDAGKTLPAGLILICPWLDVVPAHADQVAIEPRDAILTINGIREAGAIYAGDLPVTDIWISPIYGNWENLPPIIAFGGGDDILVTDSRRMKDRLPSIEYYELARMIHIWPILFFPESRNAQRQMAAFTNTTAS